MKTARGILILVLAMVQGAGLMGTGIAAGGNGTGKGGGGVGKWGNGTGICIASDITSRQEVTVEGTVYSVGTFRQGIGIDTGEEIVQVFGIGSVRYWEDVLTVERPDVGDVIKVVGQEITFSDETTKIIAFTVTFVEINPDEEIVLRDEETGLPIWRGEGFERQYRNKGRYGIINDGSGS